MEATGDNSRGEEKREERKIRIERKGEGYNRKQKRGEGAEVEKRKQVVNEGVERGKRKRGEREKERGRKVKRE